MTPWVLASVLIIFDCNCVFIALTTILWMLNMVSRPFLTEHPSIKVKTNLGILISSEVDFIYVTNKPIELLRFA